MDNHESHLSYAALELAKKNNIHIITLPPHTSNKTQPLDRSVFRPLKSADAWMLQTPGKQIPIYQIDQLAGTEFTKAATAENICSGFSASGLWPFNPAVFENEDFLPSDSTDHSA